MKDVSQVRDTISHDKRADSSHEKEHKDVKELLQSGTATGEYNC